jgi:hypothetical protein
VQDGTFIQRFLTTLHQRCCLAGLGWVMVSKSGQLLERSVIDRMVGAPERLVFEGPPILEPPLAQDQESRRAVAYDGAAFDIQASCPPLRIVDTHRLETWRAEARQRLQPELARVRGERAKQLAERRQIPLERARQLIEQQCGGVLGPDFTLQFDDPDLDGVTVADVLADPDGFAGETLADPLEGIEYGRCKAKIMRRADGSLWIHSFAHGRTVYELRLDAAAVRKAVENATKEDAADVFVAGVLRAEIEPDELEALIRLVAEKTGIGLRPLAQKLKAARERQRKEREREQQDWKTAGQRDPRPRVRVPPPDAPWNEQMDVINDVLGASTAAEPPMRDAEGYVVTVRNRRIPGMHLLTAASVNPGEATEEEKTTRLPAPEQPLLTQLNEIHLAELIERHIDYIDEDGRSVHLPKEFVRHYEQRPNDDALPLVQGVATLPVVLLDGALLSGHRLDRDRGILLRVPKELDALVPRAQECTPPAVAEAMRFLTDEWLVDVATDYAGRCVLIAFALTVIVRLVLPERPLFILTGGRRGTGKTTALSMVTLAVTGASPSAAAWSTNTEERRKAILAYLREGPPIIPWDNLETGARIDCTHIGRTCTVLTYTDRLLSLTKTGTVPATSVQVFTGNNIEPGGNNFSRALSVRLETDRADPENRPFRHPQPLAWTEANRGAILRALYMLLLGNPRRNETDTGTASRRGCG